MDEPIKCYLQNKPYGYFSNFAPYSIYQKEKIWPTVEHYFQAQKFADTHHEEEVRRAKTPKDALDSDATVRGLCAQIGSN